MVTVRHINYFRLFYNDKKSKMPFIRVDFKYRPMFLYRGYYKYNNKSDNTYLLL